MAISRSSSSELLDAIVKMGAPNSAARPQKPAPAKERQAAPKPSICVLPFANMSGEPEQEYFSDGISEDIITDLSKVSALVGGRPQHRLHASRARRAT